MTFPARVINGSEHTKWRSFTALRCEREERKARGCDGGRGGWGAYGCGQSGRMTRAVEREKLVEVRSVAQRKKNDWWPTAVD